MATFVDGGTVLITVDGAPIDCLTNATFTSTNDEIETTCKNETGSKSFRPGANEWSISADQNTTTDGTGTLTKALLTAHQNRSTIAVVFTCGAAFNISGNVNIPTMSVTAGNSGTNTTASLTLKGDGAYVIAP